MNVMHVMNADRTIDRGQKPPQTFLVKKTSGFMIQKQKKCKILLLRKCAAIIILIFKQYKI